MPEEYTIAKMCAPTLAGLKTGSLYTRRYSDREGMLETVRAWNRRLSPKGVILLVLNAEDGKALIYAFRPKQLKKDFGEERVAKILKQFGYTPDKSETCIRTLIGRISGKDSFPHEIGLFLGYPPEDVEGFINNRANGYKTVGYWKVYGNPEKAKRKFEIYRRCTDWFTERVLNGERLEHLTIFM